MSLYPQQFDAAATVRPRARRPGTISIALVLGLVVAMGLIALTVDMAFIASRTHQMRVGAEAAALAGGAELMDEGPLYGKSPDRLAAQDPAVRDPFVDASVERALPTAIHFAIRNKVLQEPVEVLPGPVESGAREYPGGEFVFGWVEDPATAASGMTAWQGVGGVNSLFVRARRTAAQENPLSLWFAQLLGLAEISAGATARASLDQRVFGFRPTRHVNIPLVPLLVQAGSGGRGWVREISPAAEPSGQDQFQVDRLSGDVRPGSDGISEIPLLVRAVEEDAGGESGGAQAAEDSARWFALAGGPLDVNQLATQLVQGVASEDLLDGDGSFALDADGQLALVLPTGLGAQQLAALHTVLLAIRGERLVWPVGRIRSEPEPSQVLDFAAGCVVDCRVDDDSNLVILVQPCLLQTCTALVRSGQPRNPWLGKLVISQ